MTDAVSISRSRQQSLLSELTYAVSRVPKRELQEWAWNSVKKMGEVSVRRVNNLGRVLKGLSGKVIKEATDAVAAYKENALESHAKRRIQSAASAVSIYGSGVAESVALVKASLKENPKESAPALVVSLLAFVAASGGVDADGGAPDLDLAFGIDAHRSIFSHSIITGAVIETLLAATAKLIGTVHMYLPEQHDPIWDAIARHKDKFLAAAATGASLGVAYHLFIDSAVQPAPYHDLPGSHSILVHQTIMGTNAAMEALDVRTRDRSRR